MALNSLKKVLVDELKDLYSAENQIIKALPKMAKGVESPELKKAFEAHLKQTRGQLVRLDRIAKIMGEKSFKGKKCKAMEGLLEEGAEVLKEDGDQTVKDALVIGAAQKVEHYEMAGYGTARTHARHLGLTEVAQLLQATLDEEGQTDKDLTKLATRKVNLDAKTEGNRIAAGKGGAKKGAAKKSGASNSAAKKGGAKKGGAAKGGAAKGGAKKGAAKKSSAAKAGSRPAAKSGSRGGAKKSAASKSGTSSRGGSSSGVSSGGRKSAGSSAATSRTATTSKAKSSPAKSTPAKSAPAKSASKPTPSKSKTTKSAVPKSIAPFADISDDNERIGISTDDAARMADEAPTIRGRDDSSIERFDAIPANAEFADAETANNG